MIIDTEKIKDLTLSELAILLVLYDAGDKDSWNLITLRDETFKKIADNLAKKYVIQRSVYPNHTEYALTQTSRDILKAFDVSKDKQKNQNRCVALADKLRQLYPEGKKPGLQDYWRDSTNVIAERLKKFFEKYGEHTDEEIIEATKQYVAHFNGNYRYMKLLKYFIWKQVVKGGELVEGRMVGEVEKESELLSYIQNLRETPQPSFSADWDVQLK